MKLRQGIDKTFTSAGYAAFFLMSVVLILVLAPIMLRGLSAVFFRGTVEFRRYQSEANGRGDAEALKVEIAKTNEAKRPIFEAFEAFSRGLDTEAMVRDVRSAYRVYGQEVRRAVSDKDEQRALRNEAKEVRDAILLAFESTEKEEIRAMLTPVLIREDEEAFRDSACKEMFMLAREYGEIAETMDLTRRHDYARSLGELKEALGRLLGPFPGEPVPPLPMDQYGATRMDRAKVYLNDVLYAKRWVAEEGSEALVERTVPRVAEFKGTKLEPMFAMLENNLDEIMQPKITCYWRYFLDDSTTDRFFGGVGPEILGTLLLTIMAIVCASVFGIIAAAYLIECAGDNIVIMIIRTCINTLAGVPSIVFGLFGLAFFVLQVTGKPCVLAGSLTLAVLVLPIIIRSSEEAIRSVPHTYKEAALALGAGRFKTFVTVVLPAALPGILTGTILSLSRAAGETAPILFTAAAWLAPIPKTLFEPTRALSYASYFIATGDNVAPLVPHKQYGMVMTLVLLVLILNLAAILLRAKISKRLRGQ